MEKNKFTLCTFTETNNDSLHWLIKYIPVIALRALSIFTYNIFMTNPVTWILLSFPFYRCRYWGTWCLSNLLKIRRLQSQYNLTLELSCPVGEPPATYRYWVFYNSFLSSTGVWGHNGRSCAVFTVVSQVPKKVTMAETVTKNHTLLFLGTQLDYISQMPLQVGMATWLSSGQWNVHGNDGDPSMSGPPPLHSLPTSPSAWMGCVLRPQSGRAWKR